MKTEIKNIILAFEAASATRNIEKLKNILHPDYRVVANRFKGASHAVIIRKDQYLAMTQDETIGGTSYQTDIIYISITDHTAMVEVLLKSNNSSDMHKYLFLIQDAEDQWQVVGDLPLIIE
ncbi:MAG: nuclear transport factor 2 family protein [Balneolaceae bacterium]|nr:nuclear transport factor 2 family protein [Balneolaceae bacterium]